MSPDLRLIKYYKVRVTDTSSALENIRAAGDSHNSTQRRGYSCSLIACLFYLLLKNKLCIQDYLPVVKRIKILQVLNSKSLFFLFSTLVELSASEGGIST